MSEPDYDSDPRLTDRETVVIFTADIPKFLMTPKGQLAMTVLVTPEDKYLAMPLTDIVGRQFTFRVYANQSRAKRVRETLDAGRRVMEPVLGEWDRLMLVLRDPAETWDDEPSEVGDE